MLRNLLNRTAVVVALIAAVTTLSVAVAGHQRLNFGLFSATVGEREIEKRVADKCHEQLCFSPSK
jgi:hypothetical protein